MVTVSYPGVYIQEVPSGVRTIAGVSTSVTAFVGAAKRGPINKAVRILGYADYERSFGGLDATSEMSYAVRQFFLNGGSEAWVVRLAKNANAAFRDLNKAAPPASNVLKVTAIDEGKSGNDIEVRIDYDTDNPASTFNLTFNYISKDNPTDRVSETFRNLSMNSQDPIYVESAINNVSRLVTVGRTVPSSTLSSLSAGTSLGGKLESGGALVDVSTLIDNTHDRFRIVVNGLPPVTVQLASTDAGSGTPAQKLLNVCNAIASKVQAAAGGNPALASFACVPDNNAIKMTSGLGGESSSVRVLPGLQNDISARLKLGTLNGGVETDAVSSIRPDVIPPPGTLTSGTFGATDLDTIPSATSNSFQIGLNGYGLNTVNLGNTAATGTNLGEKLQNIASRIETAVRALKPSNPAYKNFRCVVVDTNKLRLISGTGGDGSSVVIDAATSNDVANALRLVTGAVRVDGQNIYLQNGTENPYTDADAYNLFIASRSQRKGIYALESVDLFNLLCLPGETDPSILMDAAAYCQERRAFLIADASKSTRSPDDMVQVISGTALPKTEHGAVYYPWIDIADPLNSGKLRSCPPSGTIAGLYARIDSTRGVWKAPAGIEATLVGVQKVEYQLTDRENGVLNPLGVNCLRNFPVYGAVAWGARTLRGADAIGSEWKYIPIRRLALFLEESLYRGTKWVVFEPNDEPLWAQIRLNIGAFMNGLFRQGAFQGSTPDKAFFVKCDSETTTQADRNLGIVNIEVGFAPLKPAEFVIIKIQQIAGDLQ
ncbi:MAG: phage tail sheath subtilisin-like domain-containing protein [Oscillatoriaceae cyanobacterium Prado104]|jgi:hypothetical protein|nr:phage tail sheath subtilisin-like domain-containing protein [Oscillatoriaceae cyanobacterium Prado104]